jgi:hypothetical protein
MGDKTVSFVQKSFEYAKRNKELAPAYLDLADMETDMKAVEVLREISQGLSSLSASVDDSLTLSGSEAYQAALLFYTNVKSASRAKVAGAASIYDDLSGRFLGAVAKEKA